MTLARPTSRSRTLLRLVRLLVLLVVVVSLTGATARRMWKDGTRLEEQGSLYAAAQKYLDALEKNDRHKKAQEAIFGVAEDAYEQKLAVATRYETATRFEDALDEYRELRTFLSRLDAVGAKTFAVVDVKKKIGAMRSASAEQHYVAGVEALGARDWSRALSRFKAARSFRSTYKDTTELMAEAEYGWGGDEVDRNAYRDAAKHFVAATEIAGSAGYRDARSRAAELFGALGQHFLQVGACRSALRDFEKARALEDSSLLGALEEAAESCAVTPVAILPFENPTGRDLAGMALSETLADRVGSEVAEGASRFVRLIERTALDRLLAEQDLSAAGIATGSSSKIQGVRYLVIGKLTQVRVSGEPLRTDSKATVGTVPYECTKTNRDGEPYRSTCHREVRVDYRESSASLQLRVAGSVRVVDVQTGEQLASHPLEGVAEDAVHFVEDPSVDGRVVSLTMWGHNNGVGVRDRELRRLVDARRDLRDEGAMADEIVSGLARAAAEAILEAVDVPDREADPDRLDLGTATADRR